MTRKKTERDGAADHRRHYSEDAFWRKMGALPRSAGLAVVERAVTLYVILTDRATPMWARLLIIGALGYFICPVDAVPDAVPALGYADDVVALGVALAQLGRVVTPAMRRRASALLPEGMRTETKKRRTETNEQAEHEESGNGSD